MVRRGPRALSRAFRPRQSVGWSGHCRAPASVRALGRGRGSLEVACEAARLCAYGSFAPRPPTSVGLAEGAGIGRLAAASVVAPRCPERVSGERPPSNSPATWFGHRRSLAAASAASQRVVLWLCLPAAACIASGSGLRNMARLSPVSAQRRCTLPPILHAHPLTPPSSASMPARAHPAPRTLLHPPPRRPPHSPRLALYSESTVRIIISKGERLDLSRPAQRRQWRIGQPAVAPRRHRIHARSAAPDAPDRGAAEETDTT